MPVLHQPSHPPSYSINFVDIDTPPLSDLKVGVKGLFLTLEQCSHSNRLPYCAISYSNCIVLFTNHAEENILFHVTREPTYLAENYCPETIIVVKCTRKNSLRQHFYDANIKQLLWKH